MVDIEDFFRCTRTDDMTASSQQLLKRFKHAPFCHLPRPLHRSERVRCAVAAGSRRCGVLRGDVTSLKKSGPVKLLLKVPLNVRWKMFRCVNFWLVGVGWNWMLVVVGWMLDGRVGGVFRCWLGSRGWG